MSDPLLAHDDDTQPFAHWYEACWWALVRPSVKTFERAGAGADRLARTYERYMGVYVNPLGIIPRFGPVFRYSQRFSRFNGQVRSLELAGAMVFAATMVGAALTLFIGAAVSRALGAGAVPRGAVLPGPVINADGTLPTTTQSLTASLFFAFLWAGFAFTGFAAGVACRSVFARLLGGEKFLLARLSFACAAYAAPAGIVMGLLHTLPYVGLTMIGLRALYGAALSTLAVRAVYRFGWGRAVLANAIPIAAAVALALWISPVGRMF